MLPIGVKHSFQLSTIQGYNCYKLSVNVFHVTVDFFLYIFKKWIFSEVQWLFALHFTHTLLTVDVPRFLKCKIITSQFYEKLDCKNVIMFRSTQLIIRRKLEKAILYFHISVHVTYSIRFALFAKHSKASLSSGRELYLKISWNFWCLCSTRMNFSV